MSSETPSHSCFIALSKGLGSWTGSLALLWVLTFVLFLIFLSEVDTATIILVGICGSFLITCEFMIRAISKGAWKAVKALWRQW